MIIMKRIGETMHINKKIKLFIALISLFYSLTLIQSTYAKYISSAVGNANISIARWNILVNNQDIKNNSNFTNTIEPTFEGNANIAPNIIAPTSTGYFDITINGSNTDVQYKYTIGLNVSAGSSVKDLKITKYTIDDGPTEYQLTNNTLENTVHLNDTNKIHKYRFYVEWSDGTGETMDNTADTAATNNGQASFDVAVNVIQIAN
jgi:hypothetical protein